MRLALLALQLVAPPAPRAVDSIFADLVVGLSEPGGFFWSDNLVSNETSYLHVIGKLDELGVRGGAYIGVGPEQNFSYIAEIRPAVAFIVDIRRDNLLLHLFFKAAAELARNRLEYLCFLYGRSPPADVERWSDRPVEDLLDYLDAAGADSNAVEAQERRLFDRIGRLGVPLTGADLEAIARLHGEFVSAGLSLRFSSLGARAWPIFPTARQLYLETDLRGVRSSYLPSEERFRVLQRLQRAGRVVPVVGNLAGPRALRAVGQYVAGLGEAVSLLYTSNVEYYLFREGGFDAFAANVATLPRSARSHLARSYFERQTGIPHPLAVPSHLSVQVLESLDHFVTTSAAGGTSSYWMVVSAGAIPLWPLPRAGGAPAATRPPPGAGGGDRQRVSFDSRSR
jgi:hypothetical protein